jgi:hypothetical protein
MPVEIVSFRTCKVSCRDASGGEHAVEVTARSLYEAVARGLVVLSANDWVDRINQNLTIAITVKEPEVEHKVRIKDFETWLASNGKSPAEQALKSDLRALLNARMEGKPDATGVSALFGGRQFAPQDTDIPVVTKRYEL